MSSVKALFRTLSLVGAMCFGFGVILAIRLAAAETVFRQGALGSPQRAMALQGTAVAEEFAQRLADLDPSRARAILEYIVQVVNPRSSAGWIELGQLDEAEGNPTGAARCFLKAAEVAHQFLPAWTQAKFLLQARRTGAVLALGSARSLPFGGPACGQRPCPPVAALRWIRSRPGAVTRAFCRRAADTGSLSTLSDRGKSP